ncbi:MAG: tetratricopeptide repeat protein [Spirochaetota bacterium]
MSRKFTTAVMFLIALITVSAGGQSLLEQGEDKFMRNQPKEAVPLLEDALEEDPENAQIYLYLGVAYEQLGRDEEAVEILREGVQTASDEREKLFFNLATNLRRAEQYEEAEDTYSEAISADSMYAPAYLARANLRVELEEYEPAIEDYEIYLEIEPDSEHKSNVEQMISLLRDKLEERERRAAEEEERNKRAQELAEREAERRREEEAAKQRALLDNVLNSLEGASAETENLSGGSEDIEEFEDDLDIVE